MTIQRESQNNPVTGVEFNVSNRRPVTRRRGASRPRGRIRSVPQILESNGLIRLREENRRIARSIKE